MTDPTDTDRCPGCNRRGNEYRITNGRCHACGTKAKARDMPSMIRRQRVRCGACAKHFDAGLVVGVNVRDDRRYETELVRERFNLVTCDHCGTRANAVADGTIWHDPDAGFTLVIGDDLPQWTPRPDQWPPNVEHVGGACMAALAETHMARKRYPVRGTHPLRLAQIRGRVADLGLATTWPQTHLLAAFLAEPDQTEQTLGAWLGTPLADDADGRRDLDRFVDAGVIEHAGDTIRLDPTFFHAFLEAGRSPTHPSRLRADRGSLRTTAGLPDERDPRTRTDAPWRDDTHRDPK